MPKHTLFLFLLLAPFSALCFDVSLKTNSGLQLRGTIQHLATDEISIAPAEDHFSSQITFSIASLKAVEFLDAKLLMDAPQSYLYLSPLFRFATEPSTKLLFQAAEQLLHNEKWMDALAWLNALQPLPAPDSSTAIRLALLRCRALSQLGLQDTLREELRKLNEAVSPIEAPRELCHLNAQWLEANGHPIAAIFWKRLPSLRFGDASNTSFTPQLNPADLAAWTKQIDENYWLRPFSQTEQ
jgi:hypothetical protein